MSRKKNGRNRRGNGNKGAQKQLATLCGEYSAVGVPFYDGRKRLSFPEIREMISRADAALLNYLNDHKDMIGSDIPGEEDEYIQTVWGLTMIITILVGIKCNHRPPAQQILKLRLGQVSKENIGNEHRKLIMRKSP